MFNILTADTCRGRRKKKEKNLKKKGGKVAAGKVEKLKSSLANHGPCRRVYTYTYYIRVYTFVRRDFFN